MVEVLLINPPSPNKSPFSTGEKLPPLGLAYLAAVLEEEGISVRIVDNYLLEKPISFIEQEVRSLSPEIVGVTCSSITYQQCIKICRSVKVVDPNVKIVTGGPHPTVMPESMLKHQDVDYVVQGEGEQTFLELVKSILGGGKPDGIMGLIHRSNKGKIIRNPPRPFIENLDALPLPARHLLPIEKYPRKIKFLDVSPVDSMNTSRGCPFSCAFCSVGSIWGRKYRFFSPRRTADEIGHLINQYGTRGIYFREDNFTVNKDRVFKICEEIRRRRLDLDWVCESRVDLLSRKILANMKAAGCKAIWFGFESGSQRILNVLNKEITVEDSKKAVKLCKEVGIKVGGSFMIGIPGETPSDVKSTVKLAKQLNPDWCWFNIFVGIPTSKLYSKILDQHLYEHIDENYLVYVKTEWFNYEKMLKIWERIYEELWWYRATLKMKAKRLLRKELEKSPKSVIDIILNLSHKFKKYGIE